MAARLLRISLALGLVVLAALASPGSTEAASFNEIKKLLASDAEAFDIFGVSVAVSGNTAVVAASREGTGGFEAGAVYVFERNKGGADNWGEVKKLTASDGQAEDQLGWSVAVSGGTVIVGARFETTGGGNVGAVYVFERNKGGADNWGEVKKLIASDAQNFVQFGWRVSVSGDTAVVGAPFQVAGGIFQAGAAFVFERNEGGADNWGEVKKLTASDAQEHDWFGFGVTVSGDTAVVGAQREDARATDAGAAYVFERNKGGADNWGEVTKLTASDAEADDNFGFSVAVSGDSAVVGAPREGAGGNFAGAANVFERNKGGADNWGEVKKLIASDAQAFDVLGISVAVSGNTAVVGAWHEDAGGSNAGAAYVFDPLLPKPIGGISLDSDLRSLPLETTNPDSALWGIAVAIVVAACLLAVGGAAWYGRRRWVN